ncbi:hypothetical protein V2178_05910 [Bacillus licheniformis]
MSIEIVLLPVAIAATQAIASYLAENESGRLYTMPTVMKDEDLLKKALDQNGCKTIEAWNNKRRSNHGRFSCNFPFDRRRHL